MIVSDVVVFVELENIDEKWDRTNKCFGPVVVVICGHTFGATTRVSNTIGAASAAGQTM